MKEEKQKANKATSATERKRQAQVLREREERYRATFEQNPIVKLLIDFESGAVCEANLAATAFYGCPREQLQQMTIADLNLMPSDGHVLKVLMA